MFYIYTMNNDKQIQIIKEMHADGYPVNEISRFFDYEQDELIAQVLGW